jgi:hypothetical protein
MMIREIGWWMRRANISGQRSAISGQLVGAAARVYQCICFSKIAHQVCRVSYMLIVYRLFKRLEMVVYTTALVLSHQSEAPAIVNPYMIVTRRFSATNCYIINTPTTCHASCMLSADC